MAFQVTPIRTVSCNFYLLTGDRVALVDTGSRFVFRKLVRSLGKKGLELEDVDTVLITHNHFDHAGNLARIREASGATVVAGAADAPLIEGREKPSPPGNLTRTSRFLQKLPPGILQRYQSYPPSQVDVSVYGGEVIGDLGLEVVALPGHTPGGVGYLDRENRRAFVGDLVSNVMGRPNLPVLTVSYSMEDIYESLELLACLDIDIAYPGHGRVLGPDASSEIAQMLKKKRLGGQR